MLLALPFRYRYEINFDREAMPGRSRDALQACSLRVRRLCPHHVHSGPDQGLISVGGLGRTGLNGVQLQPCMQPLEPDWDLAGHQWQLNDRSTGCRSDVSDVAIVGELRCG